jgi:hypothetical protein
LVLPPSHLTSCTPNKSNLYFDISFVTVMSEPALYRLLTFHVSNLISIFFCLSCLSKKNPSKSFVILRNKLIFFCEELLAQRPAPKLEDHLLLAVRDCLFNIFADTLHIWRPSPPSAI